jgi:hypothetical protein
VFDSRRRLQAQNMQGREGMTLIQLLFVLLILVLAYYLTMKLVAKLPSPIGTVVEIIVILIAIFWLLGLAGFLPDRVRLSTFSPHELQRWGASATHASVMFNGSMSVFQAERPGSIPGARTVSRSLR